MDKNMVSKWQDTTEIVVGYVLMGKLSPDVVNPGDCFPPYNEVIPVMRGTGKIEDVVIKCGYSVVQTCKSAAESINGTVSPLQYLSILEQFASRYRGGDQLDRLASDLKEGKDIDLAKLLQLTSQIDSGHRELTPLSEIEPEKAQWIKTGYKPLDENMGGIPKAGLTLLAGTSGIGKTTLALKIGLFMLRQKENKKKKIAFFSLEMLMSQLVSRYLDLDPKITMDERSRILASESAYTVGEVYAVAAKTAASEKLAAIIIDFADLMVETEQSEAVMGTIYRTLAVLAKKTTIPVLLITQLNRSTYLGGIPRINHIRYSGMAEIMSSLILMVYNPGSTIVDIKADAILANVPGKAYILFGKSRFGFKRGGPGAVQVEWDGETGWGSESFGYYPITA
jgi:replicative DNA helicase